jgi:hypothetical protein
VCGRDRSKSSSQGRPDSIFLIVFSLMMYSRLGCWAGEGVMGHRMSVVSVCTVQPTLDILCKILFLLVIAHRHIPNIHILRYLFRWNCIHYMLIASVRSWAGLLLLMGFAILVFAFTVLVNSSPMTDRAMVVIMRVAIAAIWIDLFSLFHAVIGDSKMAPSAGNI